MVYHRRVFEKNARAKGFTAHIRNVKRCSFISLISMHINKFFGRNGAKQRVNDYGDIRFGRLVSHFARCVWGVFVIAVV